MRRCFVLTIIGPDRRGLVESLSDVIASHEGNWLESRMASLAGEFAGLLLVTIPADRVEAWSAAIDALQGQGVRIVVEPGEQTPAPERLVGVEVVGHDRPGIVRELARALRQRDINVEELTSETYSAPMTGEPLFKARLQLGVPADADLNELHEALDALAEQLSLDLSYEQQA